MIHLSAAPGMDLKPPGWIGGSGAGFGASTACRRRSRSPPALLGGGWRVPAACRRPHRRLAPPSPPRAASARVSRSHRRLPPPIAACRRLSPRCTTLSISFSHARGGCTDNNSYRPYYYYPYARPCYTLHLPGSAGLPVYPGKEAY